MKKKSDLIIRLPLSASSTVGTCPCNSGEIHHFFVPAEEIKTYMESFSTIPEKNNPRCHDENSKCLRGKIPKNIILTLENSPSDFVALNRGVVCIAKEVTFNKGIVEINLGDEKERGEGGGAMYGFCDGMTTLSAIRSQDYIDPCIQIHLEVITGVANHQIVGKISEARNSVKQIKPVSMQNYKGNYDALKIALDSAGIGHYISYDENACGIPICDIIGILNLFNPYYTREYVEPIVSYTGKDKLTQWLDPSNSTDPELRIHLARIFPLVGDIYKFYETVHRDFYEFSGIFPHNSSTPDVFRKITEKRRPTPLLLCEGESRCKLPKTISSPLIAAFRICLKDAQWEHDPFEMWNKYGQKLTRMLLDRLLKRGGSLGDFGKHADNYVFARETLKTLTK